jgi:hypothetical protein
MNQSRREFFINAVRAQFGQNLIVDPSKEKAAAIRGFSHCKG